MVFLKRKEATPPAVSRNDSQESEEPWDQRNTQEVSTTIEDEMDDLDDGELPSLQRKPKKRYGGGRLVNGQRTTTRPLSPPSIAGLVTPSPVTSKPSLQQKAFWSQLDEGRDFLEDDAPEDELAAIRSTESKDSKRDGASHVSEDTYPDVDTHESMEAYEQEATFCGTTLNTISELCGGYTFENKSSARPDPPANSRTLPKPIPKPSSQENTAIEVEFVDPGKKEVPAEKKNAVLSAMARKAKDDYQQTKKITPETSSTPSGAARTTETDFYNKLDAAEKRKFLKLINSGVPPASAADQIIESRSEKKKTEQTANRKTRAAKLAFWKKNRTQSKSPSKREAMERQAPRVAVIVEDEDKKIMSPPPVDKTQPLSPDSVPDDGPFAPSGINYYDAVRRDEEYDEELEEDLVRALSSPAPAVVRSRGVSNPRAEGFAELREKKKRAASAPRVRRPDEDDAVQPASASEIKAELESHTAGSLVSSVPVENSSKTVRALLEPAGDDRISVSDVNTLNRIEKELLKPAKTRQDEFTSPIRLVPTDDPSMKEHSRVIPSVQIRDDPDQVVASAGDVNFDTYLSSTDQYSVANDNASVYTSNTGVTGMSAYTQSSRVRRPGVARSRLENAKRSKDGKSKGWHATIKEAAESANLKWSPETGWVDYEDPDMSIAETKSSDKMHLDIVKSIKSAGAPDTIQEEGSVGSTPIPLPPEWEAERQAMLDDAANISVNGSTIDEQKGLTTRSLASSAHSQPRGWAETMKEASKKLEKDGLKWDSETGWTDASGKRVVADSVDFGSPSPRKQGVEYAQLTGDGIADVKEGTGVGETTLDKDTNYVSDDEDDYVPLSRNAGAFPTASEDQLSPTVDVVREKINEEDYGLFNGKGKELDGSLLSGSTGSRRGAGPIDADQVDDTWDSEDEDRYSKEWEEPRGVVQSAKSFDSKSSTSLPTKPVPKLGKSKRDTAPVRTRSTNSAAIVTPRENQGDEDPDTPSVAWRAELKAIAADEIAANQDNEEDLDPWKSVAAKKLAKASEEAVALAGNDHGPSHNENRGRYEAGEPKDIPKGSDYGPVERVAKGAVTRVSKKERNDSAVKADEDDDDSLFEFKNLEKKVSKRKTGLESADLSPIRQRGEYADDENDSVVKYGSEAYGPDPSEQKSFLKRLAECAAPVMPANKNDDSMPSAHLAFMKSNDSFACGTNSKYVPANLCGKPDSIPENDDDDVATLEADDDKVIATPVTQRSKSAPRTRISDTNSVTSEDMGPKTAVLEALAMKTATSKSKRSSSRSKGRSGESTISTSSSQHSEKWKAFLEKKRSGNASPARSRASNSDVSRAADRYAAIMASMRGKRSESAPRPRDTWSLGQGASNKNDEARSSAADDLAAARVEAMMAALSSTHQDDEVVEI